jgi:hypothetical protein
MMAMKVLVLRRSSSEGVGKRSMKQGWSGAMKTEGHESQEKIL